MDTKKYKWDVYSENCPTRLVLDRIGDKWTVLIVGRLKTGAIRFNELKRLIPGITQKMLTQTLKALERDGIVKRKIYPVIPPKVEYSLTKSGKSLIMLLNQLGEWAQNNIEAILMAQQNYAKK